MSLSSLVNKVTVDNREQPPGYILQELANKTHSIEDCRALEDLVLSKLEKNKPYVKYKTLRVIKYLCEYGAPRWRQAWQSHTDKIRPCADFRGPPDAVYGDSPYENVRHAAKEAMTAIFSSTQKDSSMLRPRIEGKGSPATFNSGTQGITNIEPNNTNNSSSSSSSTNWATTTSSAKPHPFQFHKQQPPYVNPNTFTTEYPHAQVPVNKNVSRVNQKRRKNQVGGDWENGKQGKNGSQTKHDGQGSDAESTPDEHPKSSNKTFGLGNQQNTVSDGSFEQQWVNSIVTAVGIADNIPDLKQRVQQFHNLSQSHVLEHLDEKLADHKSWQAQAKALSLLEGLLDDASANAVVAEYFRASPENLQVLVNSKKITLKKKAIMIAHKIGLETNLESNVQKGTATHGLPVKDDVLNLDDWLHTDNTSQTQAHVDAKQDENEKMFDGLRVVSEEPKTTASTTTDELFPGLDFGITTTTNTTNGFNSTTGFNITSKSTVHTTNITNFPITTSKTNSILTTTSTDNSSTINAFASLLSQPQNSVPPVTFVRTLNNTPNASRSFIDDPFANITSQSIQPQTTKSKKPDKDPFADLALGALKF